MSSVFHMPKNLAQFQASATCASVRQDKSSVHPEKAEKHLFLESKIPTTPKTSDVVTQDSKISSFADMNSNIASETTLQFQSQDQPVPFKNEQYSSQQRKMAKRMKYLSLFSGECPKQ